MSEVIILDDSDENSCTALENINDGRDLSEDESSGCEIIDLCSDDDAEPCDNRPGGKSPVQASENRNSALFSLYHKDNGNDIEELDDIPITDPHEETGNGFRF